MKLLITRLSHIGDCVLTLPLLVALRKRFPQAHISWAVESPSHQLLAPHPDLDQVFLIPKGWLKRPGQIRKLRATLRKLNPDVVIDPQGITKSALLGYLSGARTRIGIRGRWGRELSPWLNNRLVRQEQTHLVDRTLELLAPLETHAGEIEYRLRPDDEAIRTIDAFLDHEPRLRRFVVINPGASWPSKRWELERFAHVAQFLYHRHQIKSVVTWAGSEEQQMASTIFREAPEAVILAPQTNLNELAAILARARFVIACDTGPMHIAAALGTPVIGLYGPTRPTESGAYGDQHIHLQAWHQDGTCRQRRSAPNLAMRDISSEVVQQACDQMLQALQRKRAA